MKAAAALSESQQDTTSSSTSMSTVVEDFSQRSTYIDPFVKVKDITQKSKEIESWSNLYRKGWWSKEV